MTVTFTPLTPVFAGEAAPIDLRQVHDRQSLEAIRAGMDKYAVLVVPRPADFTNEEQLDFAQRFDGTLHARTSSSAIGNNRFGNEALADVSNVDKDGKIRDANNRMRASSVANRLWHTDASFVDPPGRYSMLSARVVPLGAGRYRVRRHARRLRCARRGNPAPRSKGCASIIPSSIRATCWASTSTRTRRTS